MTANPAEEQTLETDALFGCFKYGMNEPYYHLCCSLERRLRAALEENDRLKRDLAYATSKMHEEIEADRALTRAMTIAETEERLRAPIGLVPLTTAEQVLQTEIDWAACPVGTFSLVLGILRAHAIPTEPVAPQAGQNQNASAFSAEGHAAGPASAAAPAHTDHPLRHWDRTCPACLVEPAGEMPEPIEPLEKILLWPEAETAKGETVWGMGDIERGFQNMGMEINRLRARVGELETEKKILEEDLREEIAAHGQFGMGA